MYAKFSNTESGYTFKQYMRSLLALEEEDFKRTSEVTGAYFRKDSAGFVWLKGYLGIFNESQELTFTLPAGYRPAASFSQEVSGWAAFTTNTPGVGTVYYRYPLSAYVFVSETGLVTLEISSTTTGYYSNQRVYSPGSSTLVVNGTSISATFTGYRIAYLDGIQFKGY